MIFILSISNISVSTIYFMINEFDRVHFLFICQLSINIPRMYCVLLQHLHT